MKTPIILHVSLLAAGAHVVAAISIPKLFSTDAWVKSLTIDGLLKHSKALQSFADVNGGNRAFGSGGYNASADYIYSLAKNSGYSVYKQTVPWPRSTFYGGALSIDNKVFQNTTEWIPFQYSPPTPAAGITAPLAFIPDAPGGATGAGCDAADYAGRNVTGKLVLVSRGICTFELKSNLAKDAGAAGLIVYNNVANATLPSSRLGTDASRSVPSVVISLENALPYVARLNQTNPEEIIAYLYVNSVVELAYSVNVIAQTKWGNQSNVIQIGAHLDSVPAGPGINDDGSGTALVAELALTLSKFIPPLWIPFVTPKPNAVRFSWWTAEEVGLRGSNYFVENLAATEKAKIAAYLNNDMVASPNYILGIYDGDNSSGSNTRPPSTGDAVIEKLFQSDFDKLKIPHAPYAFGGSSDYDAFLAAGIPAGGVATGAGSLKTVEQQAVFGGIVGQALDQCYHAACDTIKNLALDAFIINTHATARVVAGLIKSTKILSNLTQAKEFVAAAGEDKGHGLFDLGKDCNHYEVA